MDKYTSLSPPRLSHHCWRKGRKRIMTKVSGDHREAYILDTLEQLCTWTEEAVTVHKPECLKPDKIPAQRRDLARKPCTYFQSYWRLVSSEKRRVSVLWECSPGKLHLIAVEGHTSKNICAAQIDFDGVKNRTQSWVEVKGIWEGMPEVVTTIKTHYTKFSNK